MKVEVTTRIIFKLPEESEAAKAFEESCFDYVRTGSTSEWIGLKVTPEGKIFTIIKSKEEPIATSSGKKSCLSYAYESTHLWNEPL